MPGSILNDGKLLLRCFPLTGFPRSCRLPLPGKSQEPAPRQHTCVPALGLWGPRETQAGARAERRSWDGHVVPRPSLCAAELSEARHPGAPRHQS